MFKAIIFDIASSKNIEDREKFQYLLINIISRCNEIFKDHIIASFQITSGDEWEGLVTFNAPDKDILKFFRDNIPININFYVGIGIGELSIKDLKLPVNQLDGTVFHNARESLNIAKNKSIIYTTLN